MPVSSAQRSGPVRAAVYRRMSEGKDTPDWEERQFEDGVALAERMGGTVAPEDVYTDVVSASKFSKKERKDYLRLLAAIEAPDGPRIVVAWMEVLATSASRSGSRAKTAGWCPATPFPCLASGRSRS